MGRMLAALLVVIATTGSVEAQTETTELPISTCMAVAENLRHIIPASASVQYVQQKADYTVRITYVGHSTFRMETPGAVSIATDFTGEAGRSRRPDVVTMNHAHTTHFTHFPDPEIPHVLRGWGENGQPARHFLQVGDTVIRNVTTDINSRFGVHEEEGNSIFIFETAGLCIGHLGHLHHVLTDNHYAEIGRIDILMVPVDGGYTLNLDDMIKVVRRLNASVILPMHWFGGYSLSSFLNRLKGRFPVEYPEGSALDFSLNSLPALPTIYVLQPETSLGQSFE